MTSLRTYITNPLKITLALSAVFAVSSVNAQEKMNPNRFLSEIRKGDKLVLRTVANPGKPGNPDEKAIVVSDKPASYWNGVLTTAFNLGEKWDAATFVKKPNYNQIITENETCALIFETKKKLNGPLQILDGKKDQSIELTLNDKPRVYVDPGDANLSFVRFSVDPVPLKNGFITGFRCDLINPYQIVNSEYQVKDFNIIFGKHVEFYKGPETNSEYNKVATQNKKKPVNGLVHVNQ